MSPRWVVLADLWRKTYSRAVNRAPRAALVDGGADPVEPPVTDVPPHGPSATLGDRPTPTVEAKRSEIDWP